jgi:hypothetical protein
LESSRRTTRSADGHHEVGGIVYRARALFGSESVCWFTYPATTAGDCGRLLALDGHHERRLLGRGVDQFVRHSIEVGRR